MGQIIVLGNRKQGLHGRQCGHLINDGVHTVRILGLLGRPVVLGSRKGPLTINLGTDLIITLTTATLSGHLIAGLGLFDYKVLELKGNQVLDGSPRALSGGHRQPKGHLVANDFLGLHTPSWLNS